MIADAPYTLGEEHAWFRLTQTQIFVTQRSFEIDYRLMSVARELSWICVKKNLWDFAVYINPDNYQ